MDRFLLRKGGSAIEGTGQDNSGELPEESVPEQQRHRSYRGRDETCQVAFAKAQFAQLHRGVSRKDVGSIESYREQACAAETFLPDGSGGYSRSLRVLLQVPIQDDLSGMRHVLRRLHPRASPGQVSSTGGCCCLLHRTDPGRGWVCCSSTGILQAIKKVVGQEWDSDGR